MSSRKRYLLQPLAAALLALGASSASFAFTDVDADGMDDDWELRWGLNPADDTDAVLDPDADSLTNLQEYTAGLNPWYWDTDGDEVSDFDDLYPTDKQRAQDTDADGLPDGWEYAHGLNPFSDTDASNDMDGDTLTNLQEFTLGTDPGVEDSDLDGVNDNLDFDPTDSAYTVDTDSDGMPDEFEDANPPLDKNWDGDAADNFDTDSLTNLQEFLAGTRPDKADTDGDGLNDGIDVWPTLADYALDTDSDGLPDEWEWLYGLNDSDPEDANQPLFGDSVSDYLTPLQEFQQGTDPTLGDTDQDGMNDLRDNAPAVAHWPNDVDFDLDGIPAWWEQAFGMTDNNAVDAFSDNDSDSLTALQEFQRGTWPDLADDTSTDHDLMPDGWEQAHGLNVGMNDGLADPDADGLNNNAEYKAGTDPQVADTDLDGVADGTDKWPTNPAYSLDTDGDGLPDAWEDSHPPLDKNWNGDAADSFDGDDLSNLQEFRLGTDPDSSDTDADSVMDHLDPWPTNPDYSLDTDGDGLPDEWELANYLDPNFPWDAMDMLLGDNDRLSPLQEFLLGTDATAEDTDGDGVDDRHDFEPTIAHFAGDQDQDFDGLPSWWELLYGYNDNNAIDAFSDEDSDGATALQEYLRGTWPDIAQDLDDDNDGMPNGWEAAHGLNPYSNDSSLDPDADGLSNLEEFNAGTDPQRIDSDGDSVTDGLDPWPLNAAYSLDSDGDGMPDEWEDSYPPLDKNWNGDALLDNDVDSLDNLQEFQHGSDPVNADTDSDGVTDYNDPWPTNPDYSLDTDGDGLPDQWEIDNGLAPNMPWDATDPFIGDSDKLSPLQEFQLGTDPNTDDSDQDGVSDRQDVEPTVTHFAGDQDQDFDGLPSWWELAYGLSDTNAIDAFSDGDSDGATTLQEYQRGTYPDIKNDQDTDLDGMLDGWEMAHGLDPFVNDGNLDPDGDGLTNKQEWAAGTNPQHVDSDGDGVTDFNDPWPTDPAYSQDSDSDGMPDEFEDAHPPLDKFWSSDAAIDDDYDSLTNLQEFLAGSNPYLPDSDDDGFTDDIDIWPTNANYGFDSDGDGLPDQWELDNGLSLSNPWDADDLMYGDSDLLSPLQEFLLGTDPYEMDSDQDGISDRQDFDPTTAHINTDLDQDFDGIPTWWETAFYMNDNNAADAYQNWDSDMATNLQEFLRGSYPDRAEDDDTDFDGMLDGWEAAHGLITGYNDKDDDADADGLSNLQEFRAGMNPNSMDSDGDGIDDGIDLWPTQPEYSTDSDQDGMPDEWEDAYQYSLDKYWSGDAIYDADGDNLTNLQEFQLGTHPLNPDSDGDLFIDDIDPWPTDARYTMDTDGDGMPDEWEDENGLSSFSSYGAHDITYGDNDYLSPLEEFIAGTNPWDMDTDQDGFEDRVDFEPTIAHFDDEDMDFDGIPAWWEMTYGGNDWNAMDAAYDSDGDMATELQEYRRGTFPDMSDDMDLDRDGMLDGWEAAHAVTARDMDDDGDGLTNRQEFLVVTNPQRNDSDFDGVLDGVDLWPADRRYGLDSDSDGIPDEWEEAYPAFMDKYWPGDAETDYDGDQLTTLQEFLKGSDPTLIDSDSDGTADGYDPWPANPTYTFDTDNDGLPDEWEIDNGINPYASWDANDPFAYDSDMLTPLQEFLLGTDMNSSYTDGDGVDDRLDKWPTQSAYTLDWDFDGMPYEWEALYGLTDSDRHDAAGDLDSDTLTNLEEFLYGSDPTSTDSDGDTLPDLDEVTTLFTHPGLADTDGDTRNDNVDAFPLDATEWVDTDSDGIGNNADTDDDGDGYADNVDAYPLDPSQHDGNFIYPVNGIYKGSLIQDGATLTQ